MITIKDKKDSVATMKELRLNYLPLEVFNNDNLEAIKEFFERYPAEEYVLRNPNKSKAQFYFVKSYDEALKYLPEFEPEVTICVSYNPYKEDIVLVGDIKIHKGAFSDTVDITARTDSEATNRNIYEEPQYNLHASLEDDKVWEIPGFAKIARYISDHELYDVIIEFGVYSVKLGVNKENVIIKELRTGF